MCVCVFFWVFFGGEGGGRGFVFLGMAKIISIGTVEFRYYVAIIMPGNLGKSEAIRD